MHIRSLTAYHVSLPLKRPFAHASHTRHESENILVRCEVDDGTVGWGEGVPREYVTGESPQGALAQLAATDVAGQLAGEIASWEDAIRVCERFQPAPVADDPRGAYGNALRCAVELAILDAYGKIAGEPLSNVTAHFPPAQPIHAQHDHVRYSTAIGSSGQRGLRWKALKMRLYGFRQCKVKVGLAGDDDVHRLRLIRRWIGPNLDIRIDANASWRASAVYDRLAELAPFGVSCVEQPCPHEDLAALSAIRSRLQVPVMLDESLTSVRDAHQAVELGACDLFNIRLSKCGGFLPSLALAAMAQQAGLGYQLGCHPGESGVLSAAGRHWAVSVRGIRYWEGSYDRHLFRQLITREDLTFGYGGVAPALIGPGLGVTIDEHLLRNFVRQEQRHRVTS